MTSVISLKYESVNCSSLINGMWRSSFMLYSESHDLYLTNKVLLTV